MSAYDTYTEICPYCDTECEADWVDVGVGLVQAGPFHCENCYASQIGPYDDERKLSKEEIKFGWYKPHSMPGSSANVLNGRIVGHEEARLEYVALYPLSADDEFREKMRHGNKNKYQD